MVVTSSTTGVASFASKADLTDITNSAKPISLGGGLNLNVSITDNGNNSADKIGWTLWKDSALVFSSDWNGVKTVEQLLGGGKLVVH